MTVCTNCTSTHETNSTSTISSFPLGFAIFAVLVGIVNMILNGCVLATFIRSRKLRDNSYHNLVLCLSISDFTAGVGMAINGFRLLISNWAYLFIPCLLTNFLIVTGVIMSLFQTFLISMQRYLVIIESKWNERLLDGKRKYVIYIIGWISILVTNILFLPTQKRSVGLCSVKFVYGENFQSWSLFLRIVTTTLLILTIIFYLLTLNVVRKKFKIKFKFRKKDLITPDGNEMEQSTLSNIDHIRKKKVVATLKLVGIILIALLVLSGPFIFMFYFSQVPYSIVVTIASMTNINSLINPIIYCWRVESVSMELRAIFRKCCSAKE